jgi:hypothetical protein
MNLSRLSGGLWTSWGATRRTWVRPLCPVSPAITLKTFIDDGRGRPPGSRNRPKNQCDEATADIGYLVILNVLGSFFLQGIRKKFVPFNLSLINNSTSLTLGSQHLFSGTLSLLVIEETPSSRKMNTAGPCFWKYTLAKSPKGPSG